MTRLERERIKDEAREALFNDLGPDHCPYTDGSEEWHVWMGEWTDAREASNPDY